MHSLAPTLALLLAAFATASSVPTSGEFSKRDVIGTTPFLTPALVADSVQTTTLGNTIQNLWNSTGVRKKGYYKGATNKFPIFGSCNVLLPSVENNIMEDEAIIYGPGTPRPAAKMVPQKLFNIYMFSDEKYKWKRGDHCVFVCLDIVRQAALAGDPSV